MKSISNYADILEVGVPHNTPVADGSQIQTSAYRAIKNGINLKTVFKIVEDFKKSEYPKPIIDHLLEYKNAKSKLSLIKKNKEFRSLAKEVYQNLGSRTKNQPRRKLTQKIDPKNQMRFNF